LEGVKARPREPTALVVVSVSESSGDDSETDENERRQQLVEATQALNGAERELLAAMQNFIEVQTKAGGSKSRALDILRRLLRKAREEKARQQRATFKVVDRDSLS
jgi:hypothetical protein